MAKRRWAKFSAHAIKVGVEIIARKDKVIAFSDKQGAPFLRGICADVVQLPDVDNFISPIIYSIEAVVSLS